MLQRGANGLKLRKEKFRLDMKNKLVVIIKREKSLEKCDGYIQELIRWDISENDVNSLEGLDEITQMVFSKVW